MKQLLLIIGAIIGIVLTIFFVVYAFVGFISWITQYPFNWVTKPSSTIYVEPIDFQRCRDAGGFPTRSIWDGSFKKCNKDI